VKDVVCNICGRAETELVTKVSGYSLVRCKQDGLVYVNPQPDDAELERFYASESYFSRDPGAVIGYANYLADKPAILKNTSLIIAELKKRCPTGKVFDYGCAYGFALDLARKAGYEVYGNDLNEQAIRYAKDVLHLENVLVGSADLFSEHFGTFDIVMMLGTIEHFQSPKRELGYARKLLKPGGLLVVTTVDFESVIGRGTIRPPEHLYYFSGNTMEAILRRNGFEVEMMRPRRGFNVFYFTIEDFVTRVFDYFYRLTEIRPLKKILSGSKKVTLLPIRKLGLGEWVIPGLDGQFVTIARWF